MKKMIIFFRHLSDIEKVIHVVTSEILVTLKKVIHVDASFKRLEHSLHDSGQQSFGWNDRFKILSFCQQILSSFPREAIVQKKPGIL